MTGMAALRLIDGLRARGVHSFEGMGIKVELLRPMEMPPEWRQLMATPTMVPAPPGQRVTLTPEQYSQLLGNLGAKS